MRFKEEAEKWAEEQLKLSQTDIEKEQFKEQLIFGSLLFAQNERGEQVWLKRITGDEQYKVTPVSVLNGQIILSDER